MAAGRHPHQPVVGRRLARGDPARVRDLERHQVGVVRPPLAAAGSRRLAPARRGVGVPLVPAVGQRALSRTRSGLAARPAGAPRRTGASPSCRRAGRRPRAAAASPSGSRHHGDQRPVDLVEHAGDHVVLLLEPVDDRHQRRRRGRAGAGTSTVLDRVVGRDHPAVGLAVGAERPVVLPHRHRVDQRPRARRRRRRPPRPGRSGRRAGPARERRWSCTSTRCWPVARSCAVQASGGCGEAYAGRVDSSHGARSLRRTPSSGVGRTASAAGGRDDLGLRLRRRGRRARPARSASTSSRTAGATSTPNRWIVAGVVAGDDEGAHAVGEGQLGELLGPGRVVGRGDVVEPADRRPGRGRRRARRRRCGRCARRGCPAARRTGWAASRRRPGR